MASCATLLLYYKVVFLDFCLEYIHNNGMTLSPDLDFRRPANLNKSVSKMSLMAFFVTSWQLAFSYSLDSGEQRLIGCHL
jgi:hypothetical protein